MTKAKETYDIVFANGRVIDPGGEQTPQTRLVFIARHGSVNIAAVEKALKGCEATAERRAS
jgi:hypothetical protein